MPGLARHGDFLPLDGLWADVLEVAFFARYEACRRRIVAAAEIGLSKSLGIDANRGDGRVGLAVVKIGVQIFPLHRPDIALDPDRLADGAGKVDVEAGEHALLVEILEGRIVAV